MHPIFMAKNKGTWKAGYLMAIIPPVLFEDPLVNGNPGSVLPSVPSTPA